ncbi:hypothetical protein Avbf_06656 [Armadillidium vulgare]|nr:hypothetical protein Avbf_06656 [Armadillidium vulgare]
MYCYISPLSDCKEFYLVKIVIFKSDCNEFYMVIFKRLKMKQGSAKLKLILKFTRIERLKGSKYGIATDI